MALDTNPMQLDDNLANGQTYTFVFQLQNLFFTPSESTLLNDIVAQAPDFLTSVQVTHQERFFSGDYFNVQFTYEGDGSDVVSDVASSIVAAFKAGSDDNLTFVQAIGAPATAVATQAIQAVQSAGSVLVQAGQQVGSAAGQVTAGTLGGATSGLGAWLVPVILILGIVLLFQLGGVSGIRRSVA